MAERSLYAAPSLAPGADGDIGVRYRVTGIEPVYNNSAGHLPGGDATAAFDSSGVGWGTAPGSGWSATGIRWVLQRFVSMQDNIDFDSTDLSMLVRRRAVSGGAIAWQQVIDVSAAWSSSFTEVVPGVFWRDLAVSDVASDQSELLSSSSSLAAWAADTAVVDVVLVDRVVAAEWGADLEAGTYDDAYHPAAIAVGAAVADVAVRVGAVWTGAGLPPVGSVATSSAALRVAVSWTGVVVSVSSHVPAVAARIGAVWVAGSLVSVVSSTAALRVGHVYHAASVSVASSVSSAVLHVGHIWRAAAVEVGSVTAGVARIGPIYRDELGDPDSGSMVIVAPVHARIGVVQYRAAAVEVGSVTAGVARIGSIYVGGAVEIASMVAVSSSLAVYGAGLREAGADALLAALGPVWVSLHTADPTPANELTQAGDPPYARQLAASWRQDTIGGYRVLANSAPIQWPTPDGPWADPTHVAVWDAATGGSILLCVEYVNDPSPPDVGDTVEIGAGGLTLALPIT